MSIKEKINSNPRLKSFIQWTIQAKGRGRPRFWVRILLNKFYHKRGSKSRVSGKARMDVFPFKNFVLGAKSTIEDYTVINNGVGDVIIGDRVRVGIGTVVIGPVKMGSGSGTGQHVFLGGFNHGYSDASKNSSIQPLDIKGIIIGEDSHIGANSVVLAGVEIGKRVQVGAGSVVTKNIPDYSVAVGNPAKVIKRYDFDLEKWVKVN